MERSCGKRPSNLTDKKEDVVDVVNGKNLVNFIWVKDC